MRFQTLDKIKKTGAPIKVIMSGRSTGKSTDMAKELIDKFEYDGSTFIRLVRNTNYLVDAQSYFDEFSVGGQYEGYEPNSKKPLKAFIDKILNRDKQKERKITYDGYFDSAGKWHYSEYGYHTYYYNGKLFGRLLVLSQSSKYKGGRYPKNIKTFVFDEYIEISLYDYLPGEYDEFMSILSTVFRFRSDVDVYLLGNNHNEESKYNPYHVKWNIDIDRDELEPGDIKIYQSDKFKKPCKIAFEFGLIAYENEEEIPLLMRLPGNEVATSGKFKQSPDIFNQTKEYNNVNILSDGVCNYYFTDNESGKSYFFILNMEKQSFDIVKSDINPEEIGSCGNYQKYNDLIKYKRFYLEQYGENEYNKKLCENIPYKICTPLYENNVIYGQNLEMFIKTAARKFPGFTIRYCDARCKYIWIYTLNERSTIGNPKIITGGN